MVDSAALSTESPDEHNEKNMRKVAGTALAGTSIEWYDFFIYGTAAALIFPTAFFPADMPATVALIASFSTFAVGFIARPLGGIIFGHYGDRVGRKRTLVVALLIMGGGTTLIGLLPTYETIGIFAPLLLILLRFVQGLAIGGQWGGAMLLVTESAPSNRRGYYGAFAQAGAPMGVILANLAFLAIGATMSDDAFLSWGWRLPFLASVILIGISMYVQLHLEETPAFKELEAIKLRRHAAGSIKAVSEVIDPNEVNLDRSPVLEALRIYPKRIALAAGAFISIQVTFYILIAFVVAYGTNESGLGLPRSTMLSAVLIASVVQLAVQFQAASYSDRHGRRGVYLAGAALLGVWAFALFPLIDTGNFFLIVIAISGGLSFMAMQYGPQAAFYTELFSTQVRYSGASLGYQIGAILGGAFAPTIAVLLWKEFGIVYVSVYIAIAALVTIGSVYWLTETSGKDIHE
ncbi:MHS family MFS transporter [Pseudomonadales bacterium]|nr:MHS family MFS transporter [Pseudomonadales bacterium]MDB4149993.1 MHS family MFS transporter [Pseudomonadales bacterium]MDB9867652.1 MHS family MFS transporter [Pseudomonadales bacterium]MDB9879106.1 MHS family MFS transporter [Pseudomonadales bacterium]MDB9918229.1 MHS family MFS transporter [Pseudomonadales bacterium]